MVNVAADRPGPAGPVQRVDRECTPHYYDHAYATGIEGYPDLVVHGPLLAIYLTEVVRAQGFVREFSFKLQRPVFVGDSIRVQGQPDGGTVDLAVVSGAGDVHAAAHAVLA